MEIYEPIDLSKLKNVRIIVDGHITFNGDKHMGQEDRNYERSIFKIISSQNLQIHGTENAKLTSNKKQSGIAMKWARDVEIKGLDMYNLHTGIHALGSSNIEVYGNKIAETAGRGVWFLHSKDLAVERNWIANTGKWFKAGDGIDFDAKSSHGFAKNNVIKNPSRSGVKTEEGANNIDVIGNAFSLRESPKTAHAFADSGTQMHHLGDTFNINVKNNRVYFPLNYRDGDGAFHVRSHGFGNAHPSTRNIKMFANHHIKA